MKRSFLTGLILLALFFCPPLKAATIRVEKDGSGDYTVIQDAVDAASDGDVIMIGPGRFDDITTDPQHGDFRVLLYGDKSLTLKGSGIDQTIIGPESYEGTNRDWGIYSYSGMVSTKIQGICFENLDHSGVFLDCYEVELENCQFINCNDSFSFFGNGPGSVRSSRFVSDNTSFPTAMFFRGSSVEVTDVEVVGFSTGIQCEGGTNDIVISDCLFDGAGVGSTGIYFFNVGGLVRRCRVQNFTSIGFECSYIRQVNLVDSVFESIIHPDGPFGRGLHLIGTGQNLVATGNIILDCDICVVLHNPLGEHTIQGNHFLRRDYLLARFVIADPNWDFNEVHWDFSGNYWGTTDIDEIAWFIRDARHATGTTMYVDFLPIADGPVSTECITLGGVKALFQ
jgi:hypothetical protein|nr:right-handed parallel beta-helix repeat-containing protein [Candidatus Krumholzibacteria bacterium]